VSEVRCTWCGTAVAKEDGYRAAQPSGERVAAFCRLEHVVPWGIQGAHWEAGTLDEAPAGDAADAGRCAECGVPLGDTRVVIVRHRGAHRIADTFCGADHLLAWAKAGGRWR
jgi:hypothetical protein